MLIDCGVHLAQRDGKKNMAHVVEDLVAATGGHLDLVVATHEHADHLSGFMHQAKRFLDGELTIGRLWLAWTEDDQDADAVRLRRGRTAAQEAIEAAIERLQQQGEKRPAAVLLQARLAAAADFFAMESDGAADERPTDFLRLAAHLGARDPNKVTGNELALALLKRQAARVDYLDAGDRPQPIPGASAARAYVLGPPRERSLLNRSDPAAGDRHETYINSAVGLHSFSAAIMAGLGESFEHREQREFAYPFDQRYRRPYGWDSEQSFFASKYPLDAPQSQQWRQIEFDWLRAADELALHLDRHTNNTSLVLALELGEPGQGPILLFVGDAQVGNWLSWRNLQWQVGNLSIRINDLLGRTLLYKIGHHASHNATLRRDDEGLDYGLELMPEGLMALMPVDQEAAGKLPGWNMPYGRLYQALKHKTRGNILRSDDGHDASLALPRSREGAVPGVEGATWRCSSVNKADGKPLYYDLRIGINDS